MSIWDINVSSCMVILAFYCSILMATLNQWLLRRNLKTILPRKKEERKEKRIEKERVLVNNNATILALIIQMAKNKYECHRLVVKESK